MSERYSVHGDRLCYDGEPIFYTASSNRNERTPDYYYLIMHYTAGASASAAVNWLANPRAKASAHLVIGRDGTVDQLVPFSYQAWHAGGSEYLVGLFSEPIRELNKYSLGIELDNAGRLIYQGGKWRSWWGAVYPDEEVYVATHKHESVACGWHIYTQEQIEAALEIAVVLFDGYGLEDVLGHDDVAQRRKVDPGPAFPMHSFRARLLGRQFDGACCEGVEDG